MRDPFKPNTNKQLVREAQMGFSVIGLLVAILIYVAYFRTHRFGDEFIDKFDHGTVAANAGPELKNGSPTVSFDRASVERPSAEKKEALDMPRQLLADTESNSRRLQAAAKAIERSVSSVQTLSSVPVKKNLIGLVANPAIATHAQSSDAQTIEDSTPLQKPETNFQTGSTFENLPPQNRAVQNQLKYNSSPAAASFSHTGAPASKIHIPNTGFRPLPQKRESPKSVEPKKLEMESSSTTGLPRIPKSEKSSVRTSPEFVAGNVDQQTGPEQNLGSAFTKDETVKAVAYRQTTWVVKEGDSFWSIAQHQYDDGRFYNALYQANRDIVPGFEDLREGVELRLPEMETLLQKWPSRCPADVLHKKDAWRTTPDDLMQGLKAKCDADLQKRIYVSRPGDTLFLIAQRKLGQASRYVELFELNRFRLGNEASHETELPSGTRILLPAN